MAYAIIVPSRSSYRITSQYVNGRRQKNLQSQGQILKVRAGAVQTGRAELSRKQVIFLLTQAAPPA
jgi:hypothetical protein